MDRHARIYVAGHRRLVGSALMRNLQGKGYESFVTRTHAEQGLMSANHNDLNLSVVT